MGCRMNQELTLNLLSKAFAMSRALADLKDDSISLEVREKSREDTKAGFIKAYNAVRNLRDTCPRCVNEEKLKPLGMI